ncbi:MAG TPA: acetate kinase, partial [Candidatus Eisenbacteria bacterium]|nr:acetate kinase [Candidatus Eisenbacteria bacterium]
MRVLVLNAGSSSLKASTLETGGLQTLARTEVSLGTDATRSEARRRSVQDVLQVLRQSVDLKSVGAVGHRVV